MEMHQIRYFLAVAEDLNFTRAADRCNVSQPSLSQAIRKLETELGGDLFRRERGHTHLTELGRSMQPFLRQSYEAAIAAKQQAENYRSATYAPLHVGLSKTVSLSLLAPMLGELARAFPGLELMLVRAAADTVLEALKTGEVEIAITAAQDQDWERYDRWPLFTEAFVLLAGHGADRPVVARPYCESAQACSAALEARGMDPATRHVADDDSDVIALVDAGLCSAVLPQSTACRSGRAIDSAANLDLTRTVAAFGVAGRQRSAASGTLVNLLRAADWSDHGPQDRSGQHGNPAG